MLHQDDFMIRINEFVDKFVDNKPSELNLRTAVRIFLERPFPTTEVCACLGKAPGEPECHCGMKYVVKVEGVFYRIRQHMNEDGVFTITAEKMIFGDNTI
jgi:hypothetical protein